MCKRIGWIALTVMPAPWLAVEAEERAPQVSEVAELVPFLASDRASFITGAYYNVDGGYLAQ